MKKNVDNFRKSQVKSSKSQFMTLQKKRQQSQIHDLTFDDLTAKRKRRLNR